MPRIPRNIRFILASVFLDVLGIGLVYPILPALLQQLSHASAASQAAQYGALVSMYAALQFLFAPLLGALSDAVGRRGVLLVSLGGLCAGYLGMGLAASLPALFAGRALCGISGSSLTVANAYISDSVELSERSTFFGLVGAVVGVGFVSGPLLGGFLGQWGFHAPLWAAAILAALNWAYGLLVLPESLPATARQPFSARKASPLSWISELRGTPELAHLAWVFFLSSLGLTGLYSLLVLYGQTQLHWSTATTGLAMAVLGAGAAVFQGVVAKRLEARLGFAKAVTFAMLVGALALLGVAFFHSLVIVLAFLGIQALSNIIFPLVQAEASRLSAAHQHGRVQGSFVALRSLAAILSPSVGAKLLDLGVAKHSWLPLPGLPFVGAALAYLVAAIIFRKGQARLS